MEVLTSRPGAYANRRPVTFTKPCILDIGRYRGVRCRLRAAEQNVESNDKGGLDPSLEVAVPSDQRPVNELARLKGSQLSSWALLESPEYQKRFATVWVAFFALIAGPISAQTFDPTQEPVQFIAGASLGSFLAVAATSVRIFLTWSYVGRRLMSAMVEYEETGWYDGQVFVKPPEVLARDRLLGTYEVRPVLQKLKTTLIVCGGCLLLSAGLLLGVGQGQAASTYTDRPTIKTPKQVTMDGILYSDKAQGLSDLLYDDEAAEEEAKAQGGVPGYCGDRYFRASAGGQYCKKFE